MLSSNKVLRFFNLLKKSEFYYLATLCDEGSAYKRIFKQMILDEQHPLYIESDSNISSDPQNLYQYSYVANHDDINSETREDTVFNEINPL